MKTLIALMLGAFAANHLYKSRQRRRNATALADGMSSHSPGSDPGAPEAGSPDTTALQQSQASGAAALRPLPETGADDGDTPRPGLPDFARGA